MSLYFSYTSHASVCTGALLIALCAYSSGATSSKYDSFFHEVAVDFNAPDICEKISPEAKIYDSGWGDPYEGWYYERSQCYQNCAVKMKDAKLCGRAKAFHLWSNGGNVSPSSCRAQVKRGLYGETVYCSENGFEVMKELGYSPSLLRDWSTSRGPRIKDLIQRIYDKAGDPNGALAKIKAWPEFRDKQSKETRMATPHEFFLQIVAVIRNDATMCDRIAPETLAPLWENDWPKISLRDKCLDAVATNGRQSAPCMKMTGSGPPIPAANLAIHGDGYYIPTRANCVSHAAEPIGVHMHFGPLWPSDLDGFLAILKELGFSGKEVDGFEQDLTYMEYYGQIRRSKNEQDKLEFLSRVRNFKP